MALADTAALAVKLTLDDRGFTGPLGRVRKNLGALDKGFGRTAKGVGQLGVGLARAGAVIGTAVVGGITLATREAIAFEDAFAGVRKTVSETELAAAGLTFDDLAQQFRGMATQIPIAATEFARLGEIAGALGVAAGDIDDFVNITAKLGVTTNLSADEAADAFGRIGTILDFTTQDYKDFADVVVRLGNEGASTEAEIVEITKRFAPIAKSAGLATEEMAALASVVATLAQPERAGTGLARVLGDITQELSVGSSKGKAFANVLGVGIGSLQDQINKGNTLDFFLDFLEKFDKFSPVKQAQVLKDMGIGSETSLAILRTFAERLPEVREQLGFARDATGALEAEATKRFDTVASKLQLLKNNAVEAAIVFGEGVAPAVGRAAERLSAFLQQSDNRNTLRQLGQQVGAIIDGIDFNKVAAGAKIAFGVIKGIYDVLRLIPIEIHAAVLGFAALNKASGGLIGAGIGNIAGGLTESIGRSLFTKIPGIGKLGALPVYVVNMGPGGMLGGKGFFGKAAGGLGAALGGGTAAGVAGLAASAAAIALPLIAAQKIVIEPKLQDEAGQNVAAVQGLVAGGSSAEIKAALAGIQAGVNNLDPIQRILFDLNANGVKAHTESLQAALVHQLATIRAATYQTSSIEARDERHQTNVIQGTAAAARAAINASKVATQVQTQRLAAVGNAGKAAINASRMATGAKLNRIELAQRAVKATVQSAKTAIVGAGHTDRNILAAAIRASRAIVSVSTTVNVSAMQAYQTATNIKKMQNADIR